MRRFALIPALVLTLLLGCADVTPEYDFETLVSDLGSAGARVEATDEIWDSKVFDSEIQAQTINIDGVRATVLMYATAEAAESEARAFHRMATTFAGRLLQLRLECLTM
jgi:hypothetical protein